MSNQLLRKSSVVTAQLKKDIPEFESGSLVAVHYKIKEGDKERIQVFEGIVLRKSGEKTPDASFTVLKNSTAGVKVERVFPLHSPYVEKIEVKQKQRGRRSKLYYLKDQKDPAKVIRSKSIKEKKEKQVA
jgi:large subunit ribosomal protein L19